MRRKLLVVVAAPLLAFIPSARGGARAVVPLLLERGPAGACHAVCIGRGAALTAAHCVDGQSDLHVVAPDGTRAHVTRAAVTAAPAPRAARDDLARLELEGSAVCAGEVPVAKAAPGAEVRLLRRVARDAPSSARVLRRGSGVLVTTPMVCAGDSGAALVDHEGSLVGIAVARGFDGCAAGGSVFVDLSASR